MAVFSVKKTPTLPINFLDDLVSYMHCDTPIPYPPPHPYLTVATPPISIKLKKKLKKN